jgi:ABC-type lipoprotein release transport system permease subunit
MPAGLRNLLVSSDLRLIVQPRTIMNEVVLLTLTTSAAACVPALRAAQRKPSAAMTHYT